MRYNKLCICLLILICFRQVFELFECVNSLNILLGNIRKRKYELFYLLVHDVSSRFKAMKAHGSETIRDYGEVMRNRRRTGAADRSRVEVRALKWAGCNGVRNGTVLTVVRYACLCHRY